MILGGGISGLYSAYTLLQENPVQKVIVLEKNDRWGGRIYTDKRLNVECGGARFNREHKTLTRLLQELDLIPDVVSIPDNMKIAESPDTPLSSLLWKLGVYNKLDYAHDLTKYTMEEYMRIVLSKEEVQQLKDSIGYYAEIVVMNAKDAIHLLQHMNQPFFRLEHGLSQVIEELVRRLKLYPSCILKLNQDVRSVQRTDKGYRIATQNQVYYAPWCICTLEKNLVKKFSLGIHHLNKLINGPLCRIFCTFKEPWFKDMPKYTSKTPLRIIIPHDTCLQISYSDHKFALFWNQVYATYGVPGVNRALKYFIKEALNLELPTPMTTEVHFWDYGVAYWTKNANSEQLTEYFQEPLPNFYLCSDAYSSEFQQWMEGGLCMSAEACRRITATQKELLRA
jgi:hypothetical protein